MKKIMMLSLIFASLTSTTFAQTQKTGSKKPVVPVEVEQEVPVGNVDGTTIVTGTKQVTQEDMMKSVEEDLKAQGVDPLKPKSGKFLLRFGTNVVRLIVYFNAEKGRIRWESRTDLFSFNPADLPERVLGTMMNTGRLRKLTTPSDEEYAAALTNELARQGIDIAVPPKKKVCVKLGYSRCKLVLDFSENGMLEWKYKGQPYAKGNYPEGMLFLLQSQKKLLNANGKALVIFHGEDEEGEIEESKTKSSSIVDMTPELPKKTDQKNASASTNTDAKKSSAQSEATELKVVYNIANDYNDYEESDPNVKSSVRVKGVSQKGNGSGDVFGTGNGNGNGTGNGIGIGLGGDGTGSGGAGSGIRTALTTGVNACNSTIRSGGHGTTTVLMNFGPTAGPVNILFEAYSIPDEMIIRCNGHTLAQTQGMISGHAELNFNFIPFGIGAKANTCQLIVNGNEDHGTAWVFGASCPGSRFTGVMQ